MIFLRKFFHKIPFLPNIYHFLWSWAGAFWYGFPSRKIFVIGVTGTKGKSTAIELMNFILKESGASVAVLSSIKVQVNDEVNDNPTENTMPGRFFIQKFLSRAVKAGCRYALVEVTSEGVKLNRHLFIDWNAAVFLNLHPEHIEAHGSFEKYREAKLKFFRYVGSSTSNALFFINRDDKNAEKFISEIPSQIKNTNLVMFGKSDLSSRLAGEFNKYNVGAAVALAKKLGVNEKNIRRAVAEFVGVPGRMEFLQKKPFAVVVDYAHTPDSLKLVYQTLKSDIDSSSNKLICVLGSAGGGRDKWKRPEMGGVATEYCDEIILTDEDPYDESPLSIIKEIEKGVRQNSKLKKILNRKEAIEKAISLAKSGDVVVITGKGSEKFIHVAGGKKIPWNDKQALLDMLQLK